MVYDARLLLAAAIVAVLAFAGTERAQAGRVFLVALVAMVAAYLWREATRIPAALEERQRFGRLSEKARLKETRVVNGDLFHVRTLPTGDDDTATHPEISSALLRLKPFIRSSGGSVAFVFALTEEFFKRYHRLVVLDRDDPLVAHEYQSLRDVRANILNAMTALGYAKPHAHPARQSLQTAIETVQWRTYRCLKTLHNKHGLRALRGHARGPPYPVDTPALHDRFSIFA